MFYINYREGNYHGTCDEYETRHEACDVMQTYQSRDHGRTFYYLSNQPLSNWIETDHDAD